MPQFFHPQPTIAKNSNSPDLFDLDAVLYTQEDIQTPLMNNLQCLVVPSLNCPSNFSVSGYCYYSGSDGYESGYTRSTTCGAQQIKKPKRIRRRCYRICRIYKCDFPECKKAYEKPSHLKTHNFRKNHV